MKYLSLIIIGLLSYAFCAAQLRSHDLLKYKVPADWQEQTKKQWVSYSGNDKGGGITEIIVHNSLPAAPKIDSSFRMEWRRLFDSTYGNPAVMIPKKRFTPSGIAYTENGMEFTHNLRKFYVHLVVFGVDGKLQSIQLIANSAAAFKAAREFVIDFIESVDTIVKRTD